MNQREIPSNSTVSQYLPGADFFDCFQIQIGHSDLTAMEAFLSIMSRTPCWIDRLMVIRNRVVKLFGLKNLGRLSAVDKSKPAGSYKVGDRVGIFSIAHLSDDEVVLMDSDRHLDVKVALQKSPDGDESCIAVSTIVHIHNRLGRIYMFFVGPIHKLIVPATLSRLATK